MATNCSRLTLKLGERSLHRHSRGTTKEEIPSNFQRDLRREHVTCLLALRACWSCRPREVPVARSFTCITSLNQGLSLVLLSTEKVKCYLQPLIVGSFRWSISEMEQMRDFFGSSILRIILLHYKWQAPWLQRLLSVGWLTTNLFKLLHFNLPVDFTLGIHLSAGFTCLFAKDTLFRKCYFWRFAYI